MKKQAPAQKSTRKGRKRPRKPRPEKPAEASATFLASIGPIVGDGMVLPAGDTEQESSSAKRRGRPTIDRNRLLGQRDSLRSVFDTHWRKIGWQLECLRARQGSLEDIQKAFEPLEGETGLGIAELFLRRSAVAATSKQIKEAQSALEDVGVEFQRIHDALAAQARKCQEVKGAVYEASPKHREDLKQEIGRRVQNVRKLKEEEKAKAESLRRMKYTLDKAESQSSAQPESELQERQQEFQNAQAAFEKAKTDRESEERIVQQMKERLAEATDEVWNFTKTELAVREEKLRSLDRELSEVRTKHGQAVNTLRDLQAGFAQSEFARFIASRFAAHTPENLANSVAGLPDISCRVSFRRCRKSPVQGGQGSQYQTYEFIKRCWEKRDLPESPDLLELFPNEIARLPKRKKNPTSGVLVENYLRKQLETHWSELKDAIVEVVKLRPSDGQVPYLILDLFRRNQGRPRTALDEIMREREKFVGV